MRKNIDITTPSSKEVEKYLLEWNKLENYTLQESSLKKLFTKTYPLNNNLDDILIKVCSLNDFYSTNIFSPFIVAKHILKLQIDDSIIEEDLAIVNRIAKVKMKKGNIRNFYSFATKYCSHHKPTIYPIYDSYVKKILIYFKNRDGFYKFFNKDLKTYKLFRNTIENFRRYYKLEKFNIKQIDRYLWLL